tara:strand:+ start:419 stop:853 length:435 start_codon:yes stop_codon:yes gene_type:complete
MKIFISFKILFLCLILSTNVFAKNSESFNQGKNLFLDKKFDKSKFFFEKDLVYNPKNPQSYLYLAKIYKNKKNIEEEEFNLQNVLLLDPKNDEAIYMLIILKINQSNYKEARDLINDFNSVCNSFCSKKNEIEEKFSKLIPENE